MSISFLSVRLLKTLLYEVQVGYRIVMLRSHIVSEIEEVIISSNFDDKPDCFTAGSLQIYFGRERDAFLRHLTR